MNQLNPDWLTEGLVDFEYKKYILLAYLQSAGKSFDEKKLYPFLSDLLLHYNNLITIRKNKTFVSNLFPKQLSKLDLENFTLEYEKMIGDESCMEEVEAILDFAIPKLYSSMEEGKEIYHAVEENLSIFPIGIVSLNPESGYMMLTQTTSKSTRVYSYQITLFESANEIYRGIKTDFIAEYHRSFANTFEEIKFQLIRQFRNEHSHAAYAIEARNEFPLNETLLPVAKRSLVRYIYSGAED
ncbi:MAG: hypothetical protein ABIQ74_06835 [Chitinophagales bacterium]